MIDFKRNKIGVPAKVAQHRVRPEPHRAHRAAPLRGRREALHPRARWASRSATTVISARNADIKPGNCLPLRYIPLGTVIHNVELKIGGGAQMVRSAGSGAQLMAKEGDWGQVRLPSGEMRRVHIDCRATIGQVGNVEHSSVHVRQGRPHALDGHAPAQPRRRDEPGRSPDGRRRRSHLRWSPPLFAVGQADQGPQDAPQQAHRPDDHRASAGRRARAMARSVKKGPVRRRATCSKKVEDDATAEVQEASIKTWSRRSTIMPDDGRAHLRGAQRPQVHPGVRHREHGRPQARRVRADAHLPRPLAAIARPRTRSRASPWQRCIPQWLPRVAPRKVRIVADMIRGKRVDEALDHPAVPAAQGAPRCWPRCSSSAVANAENDQGGDVDSLVVKTVAVDGGPMQKRWHAARDGPRQPHPAPHQPRHRRWSPTSSREGRSVMGQKTHPIGFRLGVIKTWDSQVVRGEELRQVAARGPRAQALRQEEARPRRRLATSRSSAPPTR